MTIHLEELRKHLEKCSVAPLPERASVLDELWFLIREWQVLEGVTLKATAERPVLLVSHARARRLPDQHAL